MGSRDQPNPPYSRLFLFSPGSHRYGTPQAWTVEQNDNPVRPTPKRHAVDLALPRVSLGYRIVNRFPFRQSTLPFALGSTNSRLTTRCRETLALSAIEIPTRLCCYYHRDTQSRPVHRTSRPCFSPVGTPSYRRTLGVPPGYRRPALDPSIFEAPSLGG